MSGLWSRPRQISVEMSTHHILILTHSITCYHPFHELMIFSLPWFLIVFIIFTETFMNKINDTSYRGKTVNFTAIFSCDYFLHFPSDKIFPISKLVQKLFSIWNENEAWFVFKLYVYITYENFHSFWFGWLFLFHNTYYVNYTEVIIRNEYK